MLDISIARNRRPLYRGMGMERKGSDLQKAFGFKGSMFGISWTNGSNINLVTDSIITGRSNEIIWTFPLDIPFKGNFKKRTTHKMEMASRRLLCSWPVRGEAQSGSCSNFKSFWQQYASGLKVIQLCKLGSQGVLQRVSNTYTVDPVHGKGRIM